MPLFHYRARDQAGVLLTGVMEAQGDEELKETLFQKGMIPLRVEAAGVPGGINLESIVARFRRARPEDLVIFTRQFHTLFKAGVSMETIFITISRQLKRGAIYQALVQIRADVAAGSTLAQAFVRHPRVFDELYVSMLAAGEEAGILERVLGHLAELLAKDMEIQKGVKGALLYPKIVMTVLVGAVTFLMTFVIPKFVGFYGRYHAELPLPTQILIGISTFVRSYWYVVAGVAGVMFTLYRRYYNTERGKFRIDRLRLRLPVFGELHLKVANARFGHILAALYRTGLPLPRALEVVAAVIGNRAFGLEVQKLKDEIQKGASLAEAMGKSDSFPPLVVESTAIGERSGAIDEMLMTVAEHFDLEVSHTVKNLTVLLEPLLLVGIFGMVALVALAIFLPIWNLSTVIKVH